MIPDEFYPDARCKLGAPLGLMSRVSPTLPLFRREFEHASVVVNLANRSASAVTFKGGCE